MITKVTITGADDSIMPIISKLGDLSIKYPFVEWGILVSKSQRGNNRFPSSAMLKLLPVMKKVYGFNLSCHLCGQYVRDILTGNIDVGLELGPDIWNCFSRVQINTHAELHEFNSEGFQYMAKFPTTKEFIFQFDGVNQALIGAAKSFDVNHSVLFDLSHGVGVLPEEWPELLIETKCGYAGGLSPDNLEEQIKLIEQKAGDTEIWIDMETGVRSNADGLFDLEKVEKCLEIASRYVKVAV